MLFHVKKNQINNNNNNNKNNKQENFQQIGGYDNRYELPVRVKLDIDNEDTTKLCYKNKKKCFF